jgi:hypothetical protein
MDGQSSAVLKRIRFDDRLKPATSVTVGSKDELFRRLRVVLSKNGRRTRAVKRIHQQRVHPETFFVLNFRNSVTIVPCPGLVVLFPGCDMPTLAWERSKTWETTVSKFSVTQSTL